MKERQISSDFSNCWVRHIAGKAEWETLVASFEVDCEILISKVSNSLFDAYCDQDVSLSKTEAKKIAANMVVAEMLRQQRAISPEGHRAVFINCLAEHPDLSDFRVELLEAAEENKVRKHCLKHPVFQKLIDYTVTAALIVAGFTLVDILRQAF